MLSGNSAAGRFARPLERHAKTWSASSGSCLLKMSENALRLGISCRGVMNRWRKSSLILPCSAMSARVSPPAREDGQDGDHELCMKVLAGGVSAPGGRWPPEKIGKNFFMYPPHRALFEVIQKQAREPKSSRAMTLPRWISRSHGMPHPLATLTAQPPFCPNLLFCSRLLRMLAKTPRARPDSEQPARSPLARGLSRKCSRNPTGVTLFVPWAGIT